MRSLSRNGFVMRSIMSIEVLLAYSKVINILWLTREFLKLTFFVLHLILTTRLALIWRLCNRS
jgi:hypothetical protein